MMRSLITGADGFIGRNLRGRAARAAGHGRAAASRARPPTPELAAAARRAPTSCSTWPASTGRRTRRSSPPATRASPRACATRCAAARSRSAGRVRLIHPGRAATTPTAAASAPRRNALLALGDRRPARRWPSSACPTCSASGAGPTTTRPSPPSATTSRAACRSASTTRPRQLRLVYVDDVVAALPALPDRAGRRRRRVRRGWTRLRHDGGRARADRSQAFAREPRDAADRARRRPA